MAIRDSRKAVRTLAEHTTRKHQDVLLAPETVLLSITSTAEQRRPSYWHEICTNTMTLEKLLNCAEPAVMHSSNRRARAAPVRRRQLVRELGPQRHRLSSFTQPSRGPQTSRQGRCLASTLNFTPWRETQREGTVVHLAIEIELSGPSQPISKT